MYDITIGRNQEDVKKYETLGTIFIGRHYVKMGQITSLSNKIFMDVARSHVVFVVGKRGTGKCLHEDSLITLADGSQAPIKELENNKEKILSLNNALKVQEAEKTKFYSRYVKKLLKIRLRSGKEIKLTPEHPLLTIKGWQQAQNLNLGARVATPRKLPAFGQKEMPEHEVKLLAYLIAESHTKKIVLFANSDKKIVEDFKDALNKFDPSLVLLEEKEHHYRLSYPSWKTKVLVHNKIRNKKGQFVKGITNICEKRSIRKLIECEKIFGLSATKKFLSDNIMQLKKENLALFLNRLFSCDGSIYKNNNYWEISYSSSSEKLIRQIQHLLLRFGIVSKLRNKKIKLDGKIFLSYELVINAADSLKFVESIGFFGKKEEKQKIAKEEIVSKIRNPNLDTIPKEIWELYRPKNWAEIGRYAGYKYPKAMRERIRYAPSRQTLLMIATAEQHEDLKLLAESDIFWDEVTSMEILEGDFKVYDISVPKIHNFIANDIIVHNSYSMGVIAESMMDLPGEIRKNLAVIMLDTMGIYWTMKYPNKQDKELLKEWDLEAKPLNVNIFTPAGYYKKYKEEGIPTDFPFSIRTSELSAYEWSEVFDIDLNTAIGSLIERVIENLKETGKNYDIDSIIKSIQEDDRSTKEIKDAAENRFLAAKHWGLFSKEGTLLEDLVIPGQIAVLDVSCYTYIPGAQGLRALVIGLVSQKLFTQRMVARKSEEYESIYRETHLIEREEAEEKKEPLIWLIIDEAHEFLPNDATTVATKPLLTILREGRQPGISLVLASQQPGKIHTDVITQSDVVIAHRVTANVDVQALGNLMQSYMREGLDKQLNYLPSVKGAALIFDDINEKIYPMRVRPRYTWHGGETPAIILKKKKIFEF